MNTSEILKKSCFNNLVGDVFMVYLSTIDLSDYESQKYACYLGKDGRF